MSVAAEQLEPESQAIALPYQPRAWQEIVHEAMRRFNVLVIHRRAGKTVLALMEGIKRLAQCEHDQPRGGYVAPFRTQAKRVAWNYVRELTRPIPGMSYMESELTARFPGGAQFSLYGANNFDAIRGEYLDVAVLDEVAQMNPRTWTHVMRPALADRQGSAIFIGTPEGRVNLFHDLYEYATEEDDPEWYAALRTVDDTGVLPDRELHAARRIMSEAAFRQEFYCDWNANVEGSYYGEAMAEMERQGRFSDGVVRDPAAPVWCSWDWGIRDATVVGYWQTLPTMTRLFHVDAFVNTSIPDIAAAIQRVHAFPIAYHVVPHDFEVRDGQGHAMTTRRQTAEAHGLVCKVAPRRSREEGIEATRVLLPRVHANAKTCRTWFEAMSLYRSEYNAQRRQYSRTPVHDWTSDYADMTRMAAVTEGARLVQSTSFDASQGTLDLIRREAERTII